jgi:hypothetical protein
MDATSRDQIASAFRVARRRVDNEAPSSPSWEAAMAALDELELVWRFDEPGRRHSIGEVIATPRSAEAPIPVAA